MSEIKKNRFKGVQDTKQKLDDINYYGLYNGAEKDKLFELKNADKSEKYVKLSPAKKLVTENQVYSTYGNIMKILPADLNVGVISNGVHGLDFLQNVSAEMSLPDGKTISDKKVMIIYECPSNNLDVSYGYNHIADYKDGLEGKERLKQYIDYLNNGRKKKGIRDRLTECWWRSDERFSLDEVDDLSVLFGTKYSYSSLPLFLIYHCGIVNLYMTNFCRFEIFSYNGDDNDKKENALGLSDIAALDPDNNKSNSTNEQKKIIGLCEELVKAEINAFKPDLILATSTPYDRLIEMKLNMPIRKIVHKANQHIFSEHRCAIDICHTLKCLCDASVLNLDDAMPLCRKFLEMDKDSDIDK